jgi:hypothetical protein
MGIRHTRSMNSRLTAQRQTRSAAISSGKPGGPVLPRREAGGTTRGAVSGTQLRTKLSAISFQLSVLSSQKSVLSYQLPMSPKLHNQQSVLSSLGSPVASPQSSIPSPQSRVPVSHLPASARDTAPRVGPTSERRDTRQHQNGFAGARSGGADEYAISVWHTRSMNSRLTVAAANPQRRHIVRQIRRTRFATLRSGRHNSGCRVPPRRNRSFQHSAVSNQFSVLSSRNQLPMSPKLHNQQSVLSSLGSPVASRQSSILDPQSRVPSPESHLPASARDTAPRVGPTSERRDTRQHQNGFAGARSGGADEYAVSVWHTRSMNSRLTGAAANPQRRPIVRQTPEDPFCHAAKREAQLGVSCAAPAQP